MGSDGREYSPPCPPPRRGWCFNPATANKIMPNPPHPVSSPTSLPYSLWLRALRSLAAPGYCHSERSEESEPLSARSFAMLRMTDGKRETGNTHPPAPLQGGGDKVEYSHASGTQAVKRGWGFNPAIAANRAGG